MFFMAMRQCAYHNGDALWQKCLRIVSMYPSYRLANILQYQQKLVTKVRLFIISDCRCHAPSQNLWEHTDYIEPYCGCDDLCAKLIPEHFVDARRMCSDVVFFDADTR